MQEGDENLKGVGTGAASCGNDGGLMPLLLVGQSITGWASPGHRGLFEMGCGLIIGFFQFGQGIIQSGFHAFPGGSAV